jgi:serine/threonine protein phosphatase PrpC
MTKRVEPGCRARVLVASDGMWDVYADDEAEALSRGGRLESARSSGEAARLLARRAQEDRSYDGLSTDDITVICVDINGGGLPANGGKCCVLM